MKFQDPKVYTRPSLSPHSLFVAYTSSRLSPSPFLPADKDVCVQHHACRRTATLPAMMIGLNSETTMLASTEIFLCAGIEVCAQTYSSYLPSEKHDS
ncbi:hypothetical protein LEMLEM_LOCUS6460 [Lemmus lemmus]